MKLTRVAIIAASLLLVSVHGASATACDMSKLGPILAGEAMAQCTTATAFEIPHIQAYARGYNRASDQICLSKACGTAIQAIQKSESGECELTKANATGSLADVTVKLYAQHLSPAFDICGQDPSLFGPTVTAVASAMDAAADCTHAAVASYFWGKQSSLEECIGVSLKTLDSSAKDSGTEPMIVCPACEMVQNTTSKLPTCHVSSRNTSFSDLLERAFSYCDAINKLEVGEGITGALAEQLKNSSVACDFESQAMQLALEPVRNELLVSPNCTALLFDPVRPLSSDEKQAVCEICSLAKHAVNTIELPTCQTRFGLSYDKYLREALAECEDNDGSTSSAASSTSNSSDDDLVDEKLRVPTPGPSSSAISGSPHTFGIPVAIAVLVNWVC